MTTLIQRLRQMADHTGLDAVADLLREAATDLERERESRQAVQIENEDLKARIARSGVEQQRAVLAEQPEPAGEPVGYWDGEFSKDGGATLYEVPQISAFGRKYRNVPLYTAPQPAKREPLTDAELELKEGDAIAHMHPQGWVAVRRYARAVIAAYDAKNGITGETK